MKKEKEITIYGVTVNGWSQKKICHQQNANQ